MATTQLYGSKGAVEQRGRSGQNDDAEQRTKVRAQRTESRSGRIRADGVTMIGLAVTMMGVTKR